MAPDGEEAGAVQQADEEPQTNNAKKQLINLLMQLRKVCWCSLLEYAMIAQAADLVVVTTAETTVPIMISAVLRRWRAL